MGSSLFLEPGAIAAVAERVVQARRLYGQDSSYVIGLLTGIEVLLTPIEGGAVVREQLHARILEAEGGKASRGTPRGRGEAAPTTGETLTENAWIKGVVKWFNNDKGYGFISTDSQIDVFVHWRDISSWDRSLTQGDEVEFMVTRTAKGFQAINVMKAGQEEAPEGEDGSGSGTAEEEEGARAALDGETSDTSDPVAGDGSAGSSGEAARGEEAPADEQEMSGS